MATLSTHILDTSIGFPAQGVSVHCHKSTETGWQLISEEVTDDDGRVTGLSGDEPLLEGAVYRLSFGVDAYFKSQGKPCFYPKVEVQFLVGGDRSHYHVPLLLNPFGYSTYRGS